MLKTIANRITSKFSDDDTMIIMVTDITTQGNFISHIIDNDIGKNVIILIDNTAVMGKVDIQISKRSIIDANNIDSMSKNTVSKNNINIADIVKRLNNMNENSTAYCYYPTFKSLSNSSHFKIDGLNNNMVYITPNADMDSMFIPGVDGNSLILVLEKGNHNITFRMERDSYLNKVCDASVADLKTSIVKKSDVTSNVLINTNIIILIILIIVSVIFGIFFLNHDSDSDRYQDTKSSLIVKNPTEKVTLTTSSANSIITSSPVETIGSKLDKLRRFM